MKTISKVNLACLLLFIPCLLASCGGGPGERIKQIAAITPTPSPPPTEREISGVFNVTGASENGNDPYTGVLNIAPQGDAYSFRWMTTHGAHNGTGIQMADATAVSYANPGGGKGCGVWLFKIDTVKGTLEGRSVIWGEDNYSTENATRIEGTGFAGTYKFTHKSSDGQDTKGTLKISKDGSGFDFLWTQDKDDAKARVPAFGIWKGSYAAASFGGRQCSFALYDIKGNGNMEGNWGGQKSVTFGTETAKRQ